MWMKLKLFLIFKNIKEKLFLWEGYCPVHVLFNSDQINRIRNNDPDVKILVHPEVPEEVANKADFMGSTEFIIETIEQAGKGSKWAIATEVHLVSRLAKKHPDKKIQLLSTPICMCSMMDRTSPQHVAFVLDELIKGKITNQVKVEKEIAEQANLALSRMFEIS